MKQYSLACINNSSSPGCFAVFQKTGGSPGIYALAWVARAAHPGTEVTFTWSTDYSFAWSETGVIKPGIIFFGSQVIPADPDKLNCIELAVDNFGASDFKPPTATGQPGMLTIQQLSNVMPNRTSIGVGMSGSPIAAAQAAPGPNHDVCAASQLLDHVRQLPNRRCDRHQRDQRRGRSHLPRRAHVMHRHIGT